ncbi:UNVERIFIED_CONTAM: hypothetical protein PYX00_011565 [Menopon gallinae]|uniref:Uncharacterized protein n=1 Tax=Menopon gallinae TaxID=328185 RepID=A0AAW2H8B3_9NEOP
MQASASGEASSGAPRFLEDNTRSSTATAGSTSPAAKTCAEAMAHATATPAAVGPRKRRLLASTQTQCVAEAPARCQAATLQTWKHLGRRAPSARQPGDTAGKDVSAAGMRGGRVPFRSTSPARPLVSSERSSRNTTVEGDRRMCDFLAWIHLAGANSADRKQRALLKSVLDHFFRANNLTEIVCKESGGPPARGRGGVQGGLYTLTKDPHVDVPPLWPNMRTVPGSPADALPGTGASRVLYSKMYYTTTITPITTILTSLEDSGTGNCAVEPGAKGQEECISTMSKADIKQDALIVAGKVQERRSKIENMLSSAHLEGRCVEGADPAINARPKYRTTFVWKVVTPYITREVLRYPQTAYYTTTELFTVTPLTTVFVDDPGGGAGRRADEPQTGLDLVGSHGSLPTHDYHAVPEDTNLNEREGMAAQYELAHAGKFRNTNTDIGGEDGPFWETASEQSRRQNNTKPAAKLRKGEEGLLPAVRSGADSVVTTARELQKGSAAAIENTQESFSSTNDALSLYSRPSLVLSTSTLKTVQSDGMCTLSSHMQDQAQSASRSAEPDGGSHGTTAYTFTKTLVITTTMILDLERIIEDRARDIVRQAGDTDREEGLVHGAEPGDSAHTSKASAAGGEMEEEDAGDKRTSTSSHAAMSVKHATHGAGEAPIPPSICWPTTATSEHRFQSRDVPARISVRQISDTVSAAKNMTSPAITINGKSSLDEKGNTVPESESDDTRKKTVTKMFTMLTEGGSHGSHSGLGAPYTADRSEKGAAADTRPGTSAASIKWGDLSQERAHESPHTHLMDIPLVSAIVREINAANLSKTMGLVTTTTTYCAEDRLARILEGRLGTGTNNQVLVPHTSGREEDAAAGDAQAEPSASERRGPGGPPTIEDMVSSESASVSRALRNAVSAQISAVSVEHGRGSRTGQGSDFSGPLTVSCSASFAPSPRTGQAAATSRTVSAFPIIKKVAIDDNFGVEIKVEPV